MNTQGAIAEFETYADAKAADYKTKLSPKEAMVLRDMANRHERRAELSRMRKMHRRLAKSAR